MTEPGSNPGSLAPCLQPYSTTAGTGIGMFRYSFLNVYLVLQHGVQIVGVDKEKDWIETPLES